MLKTLLVAAAAGAAAAAPAAGPRHLVGVPPSLAPSYSGATFRCLSDKAAAPIPIARVNDEFCDCADGSDEPGTSACAKGRLYCPQRGFRGKFVPSQLVNDGICDCCDGADEPAGKVSCKDTCAVDGEKYRKERAEAIQKAEEGARLRAELAKAGQAAAATRAARIAELKAQLAAATAAKEGAQKLVDAEEAKEAEVDAQRKAAAEKDGGRAAALAALGMTGLDKDGVVAVLLEHVKATNTGQQLADALKAKAAAGQLPGVATDFAPSWQEDPAAPAPFHSDAGNAARDKLSAARSEESRVQGELSSAEEEGKVDFGPDSAFFKLKGATLELKVNQYTYKAEPFGEAKQDFTSLGRFSGWGTKKDAAGAEVADYSAMKFSGGQSCWNGPQRSFTLHFSCGAKDELLSVQEDEKCVYSGRATTPAACDGKAARALQLELDGEGDALEPATRTEL